MPLIEIVLVTKIDNVSGATAIPIPPGPAGDLILIFAEGEEVVQTGAISFGTPAGYNALWSINPFSFHATAAFTKIAGASEPNPTTFVTTPGAVDVFFFALRISGQDLVTPVDAEANIQTCTTCTNNPASGAVTIDDANGAAIYMICAEGLGFFNGSGINRTPTAPIGFSEIAQQPALSGTFFVQGRLFRKDVDAPLGAFGAVTPTAPIDPTSASRVTGLVPVNLATPPSGGGGGMGGDNPAILEPGRELIQRGQKILNPFGTKKRHCMCPVGNCTCI